MALENVELNVWVREVKKKLFEKKSGQQEVVRRDHIIAGDAEFIISLYGCYL